MLVYDVTDEDSFTGLERWLAEVDKHCGTDVNKVIVGNKCDLLQSKVVDFAAAKVCPPALLTHSLPHSQPSSLSLLVRECASASDSQ